MRYSPQKYNVSVRSIPSSIAVFFTDTGGGLAKLRLLLMEGGIVAASAAAASSSKSAINLW